MIVGMILVTLLTMTVVVFPIWPFSREWGYAPSAISGALLVALIGLVRSGVML